jgi:transcriptional regulator with XRE-family HTH domain
MFMITALQIKAARGLLEWSQENLAAIARLSPATIRKIERGLSAKKATLDRIRDTFQRHGVEFLFSNGVRQTAKGLKDYVGSESCVHFFNDVIAAVKEGGQFRLLDT